MPSLAAPFLAALNSRTASSTSPMFMYATPRSYRSLGDRSLVPSRSLSSAPRTWGSMSSGTCTCDSSSRSSLPRSTGPSWGSAIFTSAVCASTCSATSFGLRSVIAVSLDCACSFAGSMRARFSSSFVFRDCNSSTRARSFSTTSAGARSTKLGLESFFVSSARSASARESSFAIRFRSSSRSITPAKGT